MPYGYKLANILESKLLLKPILFWLDYYQKDSSVAWHDAFFREQAARLSVLEHWCLCAQPFEWTNDFVYHLKRKHIKILEPHFSGPHATRLYVSSVCSTALQSS